MVETLETRGLDDRLNRRELLRRGAAIGLALPLFSTIAAGCRAHPTSSGAAPPIGLYQEWLLRLYPVLAGIGSPRPVLRATDQPRKGLRAADFYVGLTPFDEIVRLKKRVLVPWDGLMPSDVSADVPEPVRREATVDGQLYSWPFLLDVTILGWNAELVERAGLDPGNAPRTWDDLVAAARQVVQSGAAPYGCIFDRRPWRSLVPVTHSFSVDVYDGRGRFDYRSDAALAALEVLRQLQELADPSSVDPGLSVGLGLTPDEGLFASGLAAYYVKYQNAHIRMAAQWPDPSRLVLARLPHPPGGAGKTVFWTTGIGLLRLGTNRPAVEKYARSITYGSDFWRIAIGGGRAAVGQIPVFKSLWQSWSHERPSWLAAWADGVHAQLEHAEPIPPSSGGATQFTLAQASLDGYLDGEERSARTALRDATKAAA